MARGRYQHPRQLVSACLAAHRRARAAGAGLGLPRPRARAGAGAGPPTSAPRGQGCRPAARRADRHQGHHRHRRHADRERLARFQGPPAQRGCRLRRGAARGGRRHPRQDRDHRAGDAHALRDAQPAQPRAHARRLLLRLGGRGRRRHGAGGARHADRRLGHPPGSVLRHLWFQADASGSSRARRADARRLRSTPSGCSGARWRTWRCWPTRCRATTSAIPPACPTSRPRSAGDAPPRSWPLAPSSPSSRRTPGSDADAATQEAFGELVEHLGEQLEEMSLDITTERGVAAAKTVQSVEACASLRALLDRAPDLSARGWPGRIEEGGASRGVDYLAALNAREELYAVVEEVCSATTARS